MLPTPTVDRLQEIKIFSELLELARNGESHVLIVQAASGRGKSRLMQRFMASCQDETVTRSYVDLVGGSLTPIDILKRMVGDLEQVTFQNYLDVLNNRGVVSVPNSGEIKNNKILGSGTLTIQSTIYVGRLSQEEQRQLSGEAANGFQQDLKAYRRTAESRVVVLLLDTFEKAAAESQVWICDHLLPAVALDRVKGLLIVVSGTSCPKPSGEWEARCESLSLSQLKPEHWAEYAKLLKANITEQQIQLLYDKFEAGALKMAETVSLFVPDR
jgi:hypothetical protein